MMKTSETKEEIKKLQNKVILALAEFRDDTCIEDVSVSSLTTTHINAMGERCPLRIDVTVTIN